MLFQKELTIVQTLSDCDVLKVARIHHKIGTMRYLSMDYRLSAREYRKALSMYVHSLPEDSLLIKECREHLAISEKGQRTFLGWSLLCCYCFGVLCLFRDPTGIFLGTLVYKSRGLDFGCEIDPDAKSTWVCRYLKFD